MLIKEDLIELPPIVEPKFPNDVSKHFLYDKFYNYHRILGYLTRNYRTLRNIIENFINKKVIRMYENPPQDDGPVHPDNG